ncbi:hypothetical protein ROHU_027986 [Labeo rohita]|uniref:Uncharacterized protein n=1 Tax=Labeo rohita TaxID=84645 RepID=A0A498MEY0_LABRO|nr:hypothetical protein ROHU_027986 [Labeo rohita]
MRLAARDANAHVCVYVSARNGPLVIFSSHVTPVTSHTSRRSHNKPVKAPNRADGDSRAARGLQQQRRRETDTIQSRQTRQKAQQPRALTGILLTGRHERAVERAQSWFMNGKTHRNAIKPFEMNPRDRARQSRRSNNSATSSRGGPAASRRTPRGSAYVRGGESACTTASDKTERSAVILPLRFERMI